MLVFNNTFTTETKLYDTSSQGVFVFVNIRLGQELFKRPYTAENQSWIF